MQIFGEKRLFDFLNEQTRNLHSQVQKEERNYILNVNETQYIDHLTASYHIEPLELDINTYRVSDSEKNIPAEHFPFNFGVSRGRSYSKQVITYHVPYSGDERLLRCQPSSYIMWSMDVRLTNGCVCFDIVNFHEVTDEIKRQATSILENINSQYNNLVSEVKRYNDSLRGEAGSILSARKAVLLKQSNLLASLGVPLQKSSNVPTSFSVPVVQKKIILKPHASAGDFTPEPALDLTSYESILEVIEDMGKQMECHPSIYEDKNEEALRDLFLMVLSPHFQSVSGETFNKSGKTDILIRHDQQNIFIAECKFWNGIKEFYKAIDQLLGYLTWRDSKASLICFVRTKELRTALEAIEKETESHPNCIKYKGRVGISRFNFEFHLKDDPSRGVQVAIQCFHLS
jgi:hypothetical protein